MSVLGGLHKAFSQESLVQVRSKILKAPQFKIKTKPDSKKAAVLLPILNVQGRGSILYTLRSGKLSLHKHEVSFPGGMQDQSDLEDSTTTALRETTEELGIQDTRIQVLGHLHQVTSLTGIIVTPVVGYLGEFEELEFLVNTNEIDDVFTVPLVDLLHKDGRIMEKLPNRGLNPRFIKSPHEIWGLTAYVTDHFLNYVIKDQI